ncbi:MAG: hypothetical protein ABIR03_05570 [Ginsengibacter sp.]
MVVLFSLQGYAQTTEKSEHPLLDKYYPRKQNTKATKTVTTPIIQAPVTNPAPVTTNTVMPSAIVVPTAPPVQDITPEPLPTVTTQPTKSITPTLNTTTINAPTINAAKTIVPKVTLPPPPPSYRDTRLGSSTKQYDTWKKNNNGAGSVTTSPKG